PEIFQPGRSRCLQRRSTSRPDLLFSRCGFPELNAAALLHVIPRIHRQLADDVAADHRLAAEARPRGQTPGRVETIGLVVLHLAEMVLPFADDDVTCRAGAAAAARVLKRDPEILSHIEERLRLAVMGVRQLAVLELDGLRLAVNNECNFWHFSLGSGLPASG